MANAPNRMTRRLAIAIASYIDRFGSWPTEARLSSEALYWVAHTLDADHFARLSDRLRLRITKHADVAVGGPRGHLVYPVDEEPSLGIVERVEGELGFEDVIFAPPSPALVDLTASLFGQEVFHQLVLQELLAFSDLGRRLGIWDHAQPPTVVYEPRRGLFDLGLAQFKGGAESPEEVYVELKVGSHLDPGQFERQRAGAGEVRRVYLLIGPTYFRWRHVTDATVVGLTEVADAVTAIGASYTGGTGELARVYSERLQREAQRWSEPMDPERQWDALDYFRFYAEIAPTWPVPVNIYPVTNRSGPQYVLNPPSGWRRPLLHGWDDGQVYWELIDGRLRFKLMWLGAPEERRRLRESWRTALRLSAADLGEELSQPRSAAGKAMTAAELGGDLRRLLIRNGEVDDEQARTLYDRASALFLSACRYLERPAE